jgi:hypothetical protein
MAKAAKAAQKKRWERIVSLGCIVCGNTYAIVHHCFTGAGQRRNHDLTICLCVAHHVGPSGIHNDRKGWQAIHGTEQELIDQTNKRLAEIWKD